MEHKHTLRALMRVRLAKFAAVVLGVTIVMAVFAPWLAPYDPVKAKPWDSLHPPSSQYWLGADRLGRDQLSRLIYGARVSLLIGVGHGGDHFSAQAMFFRKRPEAPQRDEMDPTRRCDANRLLVLLRARGVAAQA